MRRAWSVVAVIVLALALGGCALPAAAVVASYSADIVSYAATGKTVTDHAYSLVARSDCSFIRILHAKPICVDKPGDTPEKKDDVAVAEASAPARSAPHEAYVTIGSFTEAANAQRSLARYAEFHAVSVPVTVHGQNFHRIVAGPLSRDEAATLKEKLVAAAHAKHVARG
jgi:cell division septation protein DedD